jgi:hypothetical protein
VARQLQATTQVVLPQGAVQKALQEVQGQLHQPWQQHKELVPVCVSTLDAHQLPGLLHLPQQQQQQQQQRPQQLSLQLWQ